MQGINVGMWGIEGGREGGSQGKSLRVEVKLMNKKCEEG